MELDLTGIRVRSPVHSLGRWVAARLPRWRRRAVRGRSMLARATHAQPIAAAREVAPDPLTLRQWLYGPGCVIPGDADYINGLISPFGLSAKMSLLDLHAGMGGPALAIAQEHKIYVDGFEHDADLLRCSGDFLAQQKLGRRVHLAAYDPANFTLRAGFHDCMLVREATFGLADKKAFLAAMTRGLRPLGQIAFTDFVTGPAAPEAAFAGWAAMQDVPPALWPGERYADCLKELGFHVVTASDATADYRSLVLRSWQHFLDCPELRQLRGRRALPLVAEAERCIRTLAALDSGALRYFYIYAQSKNTGAIR